VGISVVNIDVSWQTYLFPTISMYFLRKYILVLERNNQFFLTRAIPISLNNNFAIRMSHPERALHANDLPCE
jgi:hypothetical protein